MKNILLIGMILLGGLSISIAQNSKDTTKANSTLHVNYLEIPFGELRVTYEKPLKHNLSWEYGGGIIYYYWHLQTFNFWDYTTEDVGLSVIRVWGIELKNGFRFYLEKSKDHEGFYIHPNCFFRYAYHYETYLGIPESYHLKTLGLNLLFGIKEHSIGHIFYDSYFGIGGRIIYRNNENFDRGLGKWIIPQAGFTVGYKLNKKK